jgi:hypothetical protein
MKRRSGLMALVKVRYKGLSDVRVMSVQDLKAAGVSVESKLQWDPENRHVVYIDGMSETLEALFREEGTFTIEEVDEKDGKTVKTIVKGKPLDDTGSTVVDGTTGQKSVKGSGT